jgi:hypothetical protein
VSALISSKDTTGPFTIFFLFRWMVEIVGKERLEKDRNQIECPPTTTESSLIDGEKRKLQNSFIIFKPFVFTGLFPM